MERRYNPHRTIHDVLDHLHRHPPQSHGTCPSPHSIYFYVSSNHTPLQDSTHSALASTHYLSPSPTTHLTLTLLSLLQLTTLSIYSYQTNKSPHFWILGVGVWIVNNVWHISDLRNVDWLWNEMSGRVAVQRNIWLGLWLCGAEMCELWVGGGLVF